MSHPIVNKCNREGSNNPPFFNFCLGAEVESKNRFFTLTLEEVKGQLSAPRGVRK